MGPTSQSRSTISCRRGRAAARAGKPHTSPSNEPAAGRRHVSRAHLLQRRRWRRLTIRPPICLGRELPGRRRRAEHEKSQDTTARFPPTTNPLPETRRRSRHAPSLLQPPAVGGEDAGRAGAPLPLASPRHNGRRPRCLCCRRPLRRAEPWPSPPQQRPVSWSGAARKAVVAAGWTSSATRPPPARRMPPGGRWRRRPRFSHGRHRWGSEERAPLAMDLSDARKGVLERRRAQSHAQRDGRAEAGAVGDFLSLRRRGSGRRVGVRLASGLIGRQRAVAHPPSGVGSQPADAPQTRGRERERSCLSSTRCRRRSASRMAARVGRRPNRPSNRCGCRRR